MARSRRYTLWSEETRGGLNRGDPDSPTLGSAASSASSCRRLSKMDLVVGPDEIREDVGVGAAGVACFRSAAPDATMLGPYDLQNDVTSWAGPDTGLLRDGGGPSPPATAGSREDCCPTLARNLVPEGPRARLDEGVQLGSQRCCGGVDLCFVGGEERL